MGRLCQACFTHHLCAQSWPLEHAGMPQQDRCEPEPSDTFGGLSALGPPRHSELGPPDPTLARPPRENLEWPQDVRSYDPEVVMAALTRDWRALEHASEAMKNNE